MTDSWQSCEYIYTQKLYTQVCSTAKYTYQEAGKKAEPHLAVITDSWLHRRLVIISNGCRLAFAGALMPREPDRSRRPERDREREREEGYSATTIRSSSIGSAACALCDGEATTACRLTATKAVAVAQFDSHARHERRQWQSDKHHV